MTGASSSINMLHKPTRVLPRVGLLQALILILAMSKWQAAMIVMYTGLQEEYEGRTQHKCTLEAELVSLETKLVSPTRNPSRVTLAYGASCFPVMAASIVLCLMEAPPSCSMPCAACKYEFSLNMKAVFLEIFPDNVHKNVSPSI